MRSRSVMRAVEPAELKAIFDPLLVFLRVLFVERFGGLWNNRGKNYCDRTCDLENVISSLLKVRNSKVREEDFLAQ
jgi:hypothetical protein